jgi:hypothetical protein
LSRRFEPFYGEILGQMICRFFLHSLILITIFNLCSYTMSAFPRQANFIYQNNKRPPDDTGRP